jgi:hypothetical protein
LTFYFKTSDILNFTTVIGGYVIIRLVVLADLLTIFLLIVNFISGIIRWDEVIKTNLTIEDDKITSSLDVIALIKICSKFL